MASSFRAKLRASRQIYALLRTKHDFPRPKDYVYATFYGLTYATAGSLVLGVLWWAASTLFS